MLTIYRDSERVIHFARESIVDGRLIPEIKPEALYRETPSNSMYEGYWIKPASLKPGQQGCEQCVNRDRPMSVCDDTARLVRLSYNLRTQCASVGWDIKQVARPAWESYKMVAEIQEQGTYRPAYEHRPVDPFRLIRDLKDLFAKTRPGFDQDRSWHPAIDMMLEKYGPPEVLAVLVAEAPSFPQEAEDTQSVAYTQNLDKMKRNIRTKAKLGKYLHRHWPKVEDHEIRSMVQRFAPVQFALYETMPLMIKAAMLGPQTCMKDSDFNMTEHPYLAYKVEYGWAVAVTLKGDSIVGRAVVNKDSKTFVRSFRAHEDNPNSREYSYDDDRLEVWLTDQGYTRLDGWKNGHKLGKIRREEDDGTYWLPYVDGNVQRVDDEGDHLILHRNGSHAADHACGWREFERSDDEDRTTCDLCGDSVPSDEAGYYEIRREGRSTTDSCDICDDCRGSYSYVRGAAGDASNYYAPDSDVTTVDGIDMDECYPPDGYVRLHDGEVAAVEDAAYVEDEGEYYPVDETTVVVNSDGEDEVVLLNATTACEFDSKNYKDDDVFFFCGNAVAEVNIEDWFAEQDDQVLILACIRQLLSNEVTFDNERAGKILGNWFNEEEIDAILSEEQTV